MVLLSGGCSDPGEGDDGDDAVVVPDGGGDDDASIPNEAGNPIDMPIDAGNPNIDSGVQDGGPSFPDGGAGIITQSATAITFGPSPCGADTPPAPKSVTFTNTGTIPVTWTASMSSAGAFTVSSTGSSDAGTGQLSGTLAAGASQTLTVSAAAVPDTATAGQNITANLNVTTSLPPPYNSVTVPVSITPQGAHLVLNPAGGPDWTLVQAGVEATPMPVSILNTGNAAAQVAITQPAVTAFSLRQTADITSPAATGGTIPAATGATPGSAAFTARFNPASVGAYVSSAGLTVTGPVCNGGTSASVEDIPFEGAASGLGLTVEYTSSLPQYVGCGAASLPTAVITVGNYDEEAVVLDVTMGNLGASAFSLNKTSLSLAPGATDTVQVTLKSSAALASAVPGDVRADNVIFTPPGNSGLNQVQQHVATTIEGSVLRIGPAGTAPIDFANVTNDDPAETQAIAIYNSGNKVAHPVLSITGMDSNLFAITTGLGTSGVPTGSPTSPGQANIGVTFTPPIGDIGTKMASLQLVGGSGDSICTPNADARALTGTATTPGFSLSTPLSLDFGTGGLVDCPPGDQPAVMFPAVPLAQTVTFVNTGSQPLDWSADLNGAPFTISPMSSGTLAPGAPQTLTITADPIPFAAATLTTPALPSLAPNAYGGTLTITKTNLAGSVPTSIALNQSVQGAILRAEAINNSFGSVNVGSTSGPIPLFAVFNEGNLAAAIDENGVVTGTGGSTVEYTLDGQPATLTPPVTAMNSYTLNPNDNRVVAASFDPSTGVTPVSADATSSTLDVGFTTTSPLCRALPAALSFTSVGTNADVNFSGTNLTFGNQACNASPVAPQTVYVTNSGNEALMITGLALSGAADPTGAPADGEFFQAFIGVGNQTMATVSAYNPMTLEEGRVAITVTPKPIPGTGVMNYPGRSETLTITTQVGSNPTATETVTLGINHTNCP